MHKGVHDFAQGAGLTDRCVNSGPFSRPHIGVRTLQPGSRSTACISRQKSIQHLILRILGRTGEVGREVDSVHVSLYAGHSGARWVHAWPSVVPIETFVGLGQLGREGEVHYWAFVP